MKPVTDIHNIAQFVSAINKSYALKRELYVEHQQLQLSRGYDYSKTEYLKEKFPRIPIRYRKQLEQL